MVGLSVSEIPPSGTSNELPLTPFLRLLKPSRVTDLAEVIRSTLIPRAGMMRFSPEMSQANVSLVRRTAVKLTSASVSVTANAAVNISRDPPTSPAKGEQQWSQRSLLSQ